MTNGNFGLTGGFWSVPIAIQTSGSPTLVIAPALTPGTVTISWTLSTSGFVLQSNDSLAPCG